MSSAKSLLRFGETTPAGRPSCAINFSDLLPDGETLIGCVVTCAMHDLSAATDSNPSSRLDGSPIIAGNIVSQFFKAGIENVDYVLTFLATFSGGEIEPVQVLLPVRKYLDER